MEKEIYLNTHELTKFMVDEYGYDKAKPGTIGSWRRHRKLGKERGPAFVDYGYKEKRYAVSEVRDWAENRMGLKPL